MKQDWIISLQDIDVKRIRPTWFSQSNLTTVFGVCLWVYTCILLATTISNTLISAGLERSARFFIIVNWFSGHLRHCQVYCWVKWLIVESVVIDGRALKFVWTNSSRFWLHGPLLIVHHTICQLQSYISCCCIKAIILLLLLSWELHGLLINQGAIIFLRQLF